MIFWKNHALLPKAYDPVDTQLLRPLFRTCFSLLSEAGVIGEYEYRCAFGWLAHSRNSRLRLFTEDTR